MGRYEHTASVRVNIAYVLVKNKWIAIIVFIAFDWLCTDVLRAKINPAATNIVYSPASKCVNYVDW